MTFKLATAAFCALVATSLEPPYIVEPRDGVVLRLLFVAAAGSAVASLWVGNRRRHAALLLPVMIAYVARLFSLAAAAALPNVPTPPDVPTRIGLWVMVALLTATLWASPAPTLVAELDDTIDTDYGD